MGALQASVPLNLLFLISSLNKANNVYFVAFIEEEKKNEPKLLLICLLPKNVACVFNVSQDSSFACISS